MSEPLSLVVVGGGPAGLSAARAYRDAGGEGAVAIIAEEERMPYRRPPMTKDLLRHESAEGDLPLEDETWLHEHRVSLICGRAVALDPDAHRVTLAGGRTVDYRRCILTTGSVPTRLTAPGCDDPAVCVLRSLDHFRELEARLSPGAPVAVIGSGFIGCEIAASLRRREHEVTLISDEPLPNQRRLGDEAGREIARWLADEGVRLTFDTGLEGIERADGMLRVRAGDADTEVALVVMATGVAPRSELAARLVTEDSAGAIPVDAHMRTALADVFAAGDVCLAHNVTAGRPVHVEHWGDALGQGETAGASAAGEAAVWDAVPGFWSTIGDHTLKYAAWGDGYDAVRATGHGERLVVEYGRRGVLAGVLAHEDDDAYESGRERIAAGAPWR